MLEVLRSMRQLVAKPMWYAQVATMSMDEDGNVDLGDVLLVAAASFGDEKTTCSIGMAMHQVVEEMPYKEWETTQAYTLDVIDALIARMN